MFLAIMVFLGTAGPVEVAVAARQFQTEAECQTFIASRSMILEIRRAQLSATLGGAPVRMVALCHSEGRAT